MIEIGCRSCSKTYLTIMDEVDGVMYLACLGCKRGYTYVKGRLENMR